MNKICNIGLWGGPSSGKSTYLAALRLAAYSAHEVVGTWKITGIDRIAPNSEATLHEATSDLRKGLFPPLTTSLKGDPFAYSVDGDVPPELLSKIFGAGFLNTLIAPRHVNFRLHTRDVSGEAIEKIRDTEGELVNYLAECEGLVFLYDFIGDQVSGHNDAFLSTQPVVSYLYQYYEERNQLLPGNKLPHYVAVCIAKYDDPRVFDKLQQLGLITVSADESNTPIISDPVRAFNELADSSVKDAVSRYFQQDRIKYFGLSSIGFKVKEKKISLDDYVNVIPTNDGEEKILSGRNTKPINVFEPLVWLEGKIVSNET